MKKIVISQHLYGFIGGGEMLATAFIKAFQRMNYKVSIASTAGISKHEAEKWFGIDLKDFEVYSFFPKFIPILGIYQRLFLPLAINKAIEKERPDYLYVDNQFYKPILKNKKKYGFRIIQYIHFPEVLYVEKNLKFAHEPEKVERFREEQKEYLSKYEGRWWNFYFNLWAKLIKRIMVNDPFEHAEYVFTNSNYTAAAVHAIYGKSPVVLYPPVDINIFKRGQKPYSEREDSVAMVGRISREKRHKVVVEAISISEKKPKLKIVGGLSPADASYKEEIERYAKEKGVKVEFYTNVPREKVVEIVGSSKVFVHATVGEHFGIAVVEAMASATPAIVHRSGGAYLDIIERDRYGLSFENVEELALKIDRILESENEWEKLSEASVKRAEEFTEDRFFEKLRAIFEE